MEEYAELCYNATHVNPRTAGGLSHLRTAGGGGHICAPPPANSKTTQRIDKRKKTLDRS